MTTKEIKEKAREMFDEKFTTTPKEERIVGYMTYPNCYEFWKANTVENFIDQIIDIAIAEERKRVVEMVKQRQDLIPELYYLRMVEIITNTDK